MLLALAMLGPFSGLPAAGAAEVTDATGTKVKLKDRPARIVTLVPSLGELVAELAEDGIERVVGVSEYTDYPPALSKKTSIGPYHQFSIEKVASLKPDLVLATADGNPKDAVNHLRELGLPVVVVSTHTLREVEESILLVGKAVGAEDRGRKIAEQLRRGIENFRKRAQARPAPPPRALLQIGDEPLVVVGGKSFLHEALGTVGASNIYADASAHYPRPALEDAVRRDPDVILVLALGKDLSPFREMAGRWKEFTKVKAVKRQRIHVLQGDLILRPTLRMLEGLSILERTIHGGT